MADLEKSVRTRLLAHAGVAALVATQGTDRVWYSALPQDPTLPAVTVQEISAVPESLMGDDAGIALGRIQVDAWADNRADAKTLGEQVRDALQRHRGTHNSSALTFTSMNSAGVRYEADGRVWRHRQDFEVWFTEVVA